MKQRTIRPMILLAVLLLAGGSLSGCGGDDGNNSANNTQTDTGDGDAGTEDIGDEDTGMSDSGTDDTGTNDTGTEDTGPELCGADQRVASGSCVACPAGTTNEAGDDPSGEDTQCDAVLCEENERVEDNTCVACAGDLVSRAGADASGPNTQCYDNDDCFAAVGVDCTTAEQGYFKGDPSVNGGFFGFKVAMDDAGDTLAVSAPFVGKPSSGNVPFPATGKVYVFAKAGGGWAQQAVLYPSPGDGGDRFGYSLALDGDRIVVGALRDDSNGTGPEDNTLETSGAAYVFTRSGQDWTQTAFLKADNAGVADEFGRSVDIDGDTIAVGAWLEQSKFGGVDADGTDNTLANAGAAYVFEESAGAWSQTAYIKQPLPGQGDQFGAEIALDGDTLVVASQFEDSSAQGVDGNLDNEDARESGAAFVYVRDAGSWSLQASLKASNADAGDRFGYRVALDGDTLAVVSVREQSSASGVGGDQDDNTGNGGAVYVFTRSSETWTQQAYIKPSYNDPGAFTTAYGQSLELNDNGALLAVGAALDPSGATSIGGDMTDSSTADAGAVFLYQRDDAGAWSDKAFVKSFNTHAEQRFGQDVAISESGKFLFVGAHWEDGTSSGLNGDPTQLGGDRRGAAYLYQIAPW